MQAALWLEWAVAEGVQPADQRAGTQEAVDSVQAKISRQNQALAAQDFAPKLLSPKMLPETFP